MPISGYAAVTYDPNDPEGTEFQLGNGYYERVMPGAFDASLSAGDDVVLLFNHDPNILLARTSAGTLELSVDRRGLKYAAKDSDTQMYRDVEMLQRRGELRGSSFAFVVTEEKYVRDGDKTVREIHSVSLRDVSPVTYPSYPGTDTGGVSRRCVSPEGRCLNPNVEMMAECRSAIAAGLEAAEKAIEREKVQVRARAIDVSG